MKKYSQAKEYSKKVIKESLKGNIGKPKKFLQEFRDFAIKGNVVDLAVAVVIGAAFGKIVSSLVADIAMPAVGLLAGGVDFPSWKIVLKEAVLKPNGSIARQAVTMNIGTFVQNIFDFVIIALAVFLMVKFINKLRRKMGGAAITPLTKDQQLLTEIRDLLRSDKEDKE